MRPCVHVNLIHLVCQHLRVDALSRRYELVQESQSRHKNTSRLIWLHIDRCIQTALIARYVTSNLPLIFVYIVGVDNYQGDNLGQSIA